MKYDAKSTLARTIPACLLERLFPKDLLFD